MLNGIWDQAWKFVLEQIFGVNYSTEAPLREQLLTALFNRLLNPRQPEITTQTYFDLLSAFASVALTLFFIELGVRLVRMAKSDADNSEELKQLSITFGYLFFGLALTPGFLLSAQLLSSKLGQYFAGLATKTTDVNGIVQQVLAGSGSGRLDFVLSSVQVVAIAILGGWVYFTPIMLWLSTIALIIGISLKFLGEWGVRLFKWSLYFTLSAVIGSGAILLVIGLGTGAVARIYPTQDPDDKFGRAMGSTGILIVAVIVVIVLIASLSHHMKALVSGAVKAVGKLRGDGGSGGSGKERGSNTRQDQRAADTHIAHTKQRSPKAQGQASRKEGQQSATTTVTSPEPARRSSSTTNRVRTKASGGGDLQPTWRKPGTDNTTAAQTAARYQHQDAQRVSTSATSTATATSSSSSVNGSRPASHGSGSNGRQTSSAGSARPTTLNGSASRTPSNSSSTK